MTKLSNQQLSKLLSNYKNRKGIEKWAAADVLTENSLDLAQEVLELRAALRNVADPLDHLQRRAKAMGCGLDAIAAVRLAEDADYIKSIALSALQDTPNDQ